MAVSVAVLVAILFVSVIAGTISYYNGVVNDKKSKIASLNTQIESQNNQISNLTAQVANLESAYLVTALGAREMPYGGAPYCHLLITGSVNNTGKGTAYNAELRVVAYDASVALEINTTIPLASGGEPFGSDAATDNFVSNNYYVGVDGINLQIANLGGGQNAPIELTILHEGTVTNWTVTPEWTNTP